MTLGVASTVDTSMTHIIEEDLSVERFFSIVNFQENFPTEFLFNRNNPCLFYLLRFDSNHNNPCLFIFYDSIRI